MGKALAGLASGLVSGYMMGKKMQADEEERKAKEEERQWRREDRQRETDARTIAAETIGRAGTMTPEVSGEDALKMVETAKQNALAGAADDKDRAAIEENYAPSISHLQAQRGVPVMAATNYTRDQANADYIRRVGAIDPAKAAQFEATQMQLDENRDKADRRKKLKTIDAESGEYMKGRTEIGEDGKPIMPSPETQIDGMRFRAYKLAEAGLHAESADQMRQAFDHQKLMLQADTDKRTVAARDAGQMVLNGDFTGAFGVINKFVPSGWDAVGATVGKDGSITVSRKSTMDGTELEPMKFKDAQHLAASIRSLADPNAASLYLATSWKQDMDRRQLANDSARVGIAREQLEQGKRQLVQDENGAYVVSLGSGKTPASVVAVQGIGGKAGKSGEAVAKLLDDVRSQVSTNMKGGAFANMDPDMTKKLDKVTEKAGEIVAEHQKAGTLKGLNSAQLYTEAVKRATGMQSFNAPADLEAAIKSGSVKKGDKVMTPKGLITIGG